jgi:hypothetical protein
MARMIAPRAGASAMMWKLYAFGLLHLTVGIAGLAMGW